MSSTGTVNDACVGAPGSGATESGGNASATVNVLVPAGETSRRSEWMTASPAVIVSTTSAPSAAS